MVHGKLGVEVQRKEHALIGKQSARAFHVQIGLTEELRVDAKGIGFIDEPSVWRRRKRLSQLVDVAGRWCSAALLSHDDCVEGVAASRSTWHSSRTA